MQDKTKVKIRHLKKRKRYSNNSKNDNNSVSIPIETMNTTGMAGNHKNKNIKNRKIELKTITDGLLALINESNLTTESREVVKLLHSQYQFELTVLRKTYPQAHENLKEANQLKKHIQQKKKAKRKKERQRKATEFIEKNHKLSGFNRINRRPLQGGAPGLGKKS